MKRVRRETQNGIESAPASVVAVANMNQFRGVGIPRVTDRPNELNEFSRKEYPSG